jgi:uncharacterized membrane protein YhiD involved in acid resistance
MTRGVRLIALLLAAAFLAVGAAVVWNGAAPSTPAAQPAQAPKPGGHKSQKAKEGGVQATPTPELEQVLFGPRETAEPMTETRAVEEAAVRLPIAAGLGAILAFRPRRRGTPPRTPPVIQTQIILAVVGALVMLIVGSSLARAFGIVGAAGLIRYRARIEDPKDAAVMLSTLGVGLASGVGLHLLAAFATLFVLGVLWIIESMEEGRQHFDLTIKADDAARLRPAVERALARNGVGYELRTSSESDLCYKVGLPLDHTTEQVSNAILRLGHEHPVSVEWEERKKP